MKIQKTKIDGLLLIEPTVFEDSRGYFFENYRSDKLKEFGIDVHFVQENESLSNKGIVRGLHFQSPPFAQAKIVRVVKGSIIDVAVDIRVGSPTYGEHVVVQLNEKNKTSFLIPEGFAHGFSCLENNTIVQYKCSTVYNKASEQGIRWDDPQLGIEWQVEDPTISEKDEKLPSFSDFSSPF